MALEVSRARLAMSAVLLDGKILRLASVDAPVVRRPDDVVIRVRAAGLCRTDLYVASGVVPVATPLVLGHEFSGIVEAAGPAARACPGDHVTVNPALPCGACASCLDGRSLLCLTPQFLGVARDGAFAELVAVPDVAVHRLPDTLDFRKGAYVEPVAASLAAPHSGIDPHERGLVYGSNRIADLTLRILRANGFEGVDTWESTSSAALDGRAASYDFVIETVAPAESFAAILELLRPRGLLVLKSRKLQPVAFNVARAVQKEIRVSAVNYGDFDEAVKLLAADLEVDDLFGASYPLEEFDALFAAGKKAESLKLFFEPVS